VDARHRAAERAYRADPNAQTLAALRRFTGLLLPMDPSDAHAARRIRIAEIISPGRLSLIVKLCHGIRVVPPRGDVVRCRGRVEVVIRWVVDGRIHTSRWAADAARYHALGTVVSARTAEATIAGWAESIANHANRFIPRFYADLTESGPIRYAAPAPQSPPPS